MLYDIAIIGSGVIGALTARELSRYNLKICILEKENDVALGASSANSGIVHAGHDAIEGSLKARFNALGSVMMPFVCAELGVKYKNNGSLVIGSDEKDLQTINALYARGQKNGIKNLEVIDRDKLLSLEPNIADSAKFALHAKTGGIVCPYNLTIAATGNAMDNGAELLLEFEVTKIKITEKGFVLTSASGKKVEARAVINCAGLFSDKIAGLIGDNSFKIHARKGEYILLSKESGGFVNSTLFACPNEKGKGVLVSPTVDGNCLLGPTSVEIEDKEDNSTSALGFDYIKQNAARLVKNPPLHTTITSFCGIRAYSDRHDFILEHSAKDKRFINISGIESPGLSASPAIAVEAAKMALSVLGGAEKKASFNPYRAADDFFEAKSTAQKNDLIKKDPTFGKIICRCEGVTLGEILHALRSNPIPKTIDAIKRRTRSGMGRCQGGFCQPSVAEAIRSELNIPLEEIMKNGGKSYIFTGKIK